MRVKKKKKNLEGEQDLEHNNFIQFFLTIMQIRVWSLSFL